MRYHNDKDKIIIVDFGSQVTKLIARRIRDLGVYSEIITPKDFSNIKYFKNIKGIIFSGGPSTVTNKKFQSVPREIFKKNIPILGICYGLQLIAKLFVKTKRLSLPDLTYLHQSLLFEAPFN